MAFGLGDLRLAPREFWAMTPRELAAAANIRRNEMSVPPTRRGLAALMQRYPDGVRPNQAANDFDRRG